MTDHSPSPNRNKVLHDGVDWRRLRFYQKADTLYQMTYVFCKRFLPTYGDRTVDQMIQAARSGKQNIVEGIEDGKTSTEMELRLLNVARSSLQELREDYEDYLKTRNLTIWKPGHRRYDALLEFCRTHNVYTDYDLFVNRWTAEEFCNTALSLCHITDRMMCKYLDHLQRQFVEQGGIKERMYSARTGYRKQQDELLAKLREEVATLQRENAALKRKLEQMMNEHRSR
jgi:four helix bundle suffix protein